MKEQIQSTSDLIKYLYIQQQNSNDSRLKLGLEPIKTHFLGSI